MAPGDGNGEGLGLTTSMRLANIAPRLGIIDLCIQPPGGSFGQPLFSAPDASGGGPSDGGSIFDVQEEEDAEASDGSGLEAGADTSTVDARVPDAGVLDSTTEAGDASEEAGLDAGAPAPDSGVGLAPLAMSRYYELANAGTFVFAIVQYGASSCDAPLFTQEVTLDPGQRITVVLAPTLPTRFDAGRTDAETADAGSLATTPLHRLLVFTDEPSTASFAPRTRFISIASPENPAASTTTLSVAALNTAAKLWPLASAVGPDAVASPSSAPPIVDALGYHVGSVIRGSLALRIGDEGEGGALSWTSATGDLDLLPGTAHTGFIVGEGLQSFRVLWCDDQAQAPLLTPCLLLGP
jgi:hypothetical protein